MKGFFAYIRVSTVRQGEHGVSLHEQKRLIEDFARRNELRIVEWFEESETAAKRGRPVFSRLLRKLQKGEADGLIVHKIDRSSRNMHDWADVGELLDQGVDVRFVQENLDLRERSGRLSADLLAVIAADFIRNLREETKKGMHGRLRQGLYPWKAPTGYRDMGGGKPKAIDEIHGPLVCEAFRLYATGKYSLIALAEKMHALGLRTSRGGKVHIEALRTILANPFYIGVIRINKTGECFPGAHSPLIEKNVFDRVQDVLSGRHRFQKSKHDHTYRKLFACQACGRMLIGERQKGHVYYRCHTRNCLTKGVREEVLDRAISSIIQVLQLLPDQEKELIEMIQEQRGLDSVQRETRKRSLDLSIANIQRRKDRLTDAFVDGQLERGIFEERNQRLLSELQDLRHQRNSMEETKQRETQEMMEIVELLKTPWMSFKLSPAPQKRDFVLKTTSNRMLHQKNPLIELKSGFRKIFEVQNVLKCTHFRDAGRIRNGKNVSQEHSSMQDSKKAAQEIFEIVWASAARSTVSHPENNARGEEEPFASPFGSNKETISCARRYNCSANNT